MNFDDLQNQFADVFLLALEKRDAYTKEHSSRISLLAREISMELQLGGISVKKIVLAAKLHDIGKIGISDAILLKPGKLDSEEFRIIKTHSEIGAGMLDKISIFSHIKSFVLLHHERFDGNGYPYGLKGNEIPVESKIIGIVDAVDAMLSRRSYKNPMPLAAVLDEIENNKGKQFDPYIANKAIKVIKNYMDLFVETTQIEMFTGSGYGL